MRKIILFFIRKIKGWILKLHIHFILEPFSNILLNLVYVSKLSKWTQNTKMPQFNDFYSKNRNYQKRYELYKHIINNESLNEIIYLEFGVANGDSFKWWIDNIKDENSVFVGFDTFTGLPENWSSLYKRGAMSFPIPDIKDKRCEFKVGLFQDTLPTFLMEFHSKSRKVIHMDADIYTATLFVLTSLYPILEKDDIIFFDEFNVPTHEFRAFTNFAESYYLKYKVIGAVNNYYQIAIKIL